MIFITELHSSLQFSDASLDLDSFGKKKKKKKTKKTTFNLDDLETNLPDSSSGANDSGIVENGEMHGDSNVEVEHALPKFNLVLLLPSAVIFSYLYTGRLFFGHGFL